MGLVRIAEQLKREVSRLHFGPPVAYVYNPLEYAWAAHRSYLERYGSGTREVVMMGMNPGPWGMAQTGVPFGEVSVVRDWLGIDARISKPPVEHPKRPIEGFACRRSEVSGARLWGWVRDTFGQADAFFERFFIVNYCPLVFMEESGKNRTPDKLPPKEREPLIEICDRALEKTIEVLQPRFVVGIGAFAEQRARSSLEHSGVNARIGRILHPSPASPLANVDWPKKTEEALAAMGIELPKRAAPPSKRARGEARRLRASRGAV
jgi:single-strand selective monofunctional uracil DNA glycosylase